MRWQVSEKTSYVRNIYAFGINNARLCPTNRTAEMLHLNLENLELRRIGTKLKTRKSAPRRQFPTPLNGFKIHLHVRKQSIDPVLLTITITVFIHQNRVKHIHERRQKAYCRARPTSDPDRSPVMQCEVTGAKIAASTLERPSLVITPSRE